MKILVAGELNPDLILRNYRIFPEQAIEEKTNLTDTHFSWHLAAPPLGFGLQDFLKTTGLAIGNGRAVSRDSQGTAPARR